MSRPCILTNDADRDIDRLYEDGIRKRGLAQADDYVLGLDRILDLIADNPRMARVRKEITTPIAYTTIGLMF